MKTAPRIVNFDDFGSQLGNVRKQLPGNSISTILGLGLGSVWAWLRLSLGLAWVWFGLG